jgi:YHS domain-containing protein
MKLMLTTAAFAGIVFVASPLLMAKPANNNAAESTAAPKVFSSPQKVGTRATCPVTGEQFTIAKDTLHVEHKGKHVYFCCPGCKSSFDKDPDKYTK